MNPSYPRLGDRFRIAGREGVWVVDAENWKGWVFFVCESLGKDPIIRWNRSDIEARFFAALTPVES
jgi:hypothetical protein